MQLRVATCLELPEVDVDEAPLAAALTAAGIEFALLAWDDPTVDWDTPAPTVLRSTWNYADHRDRFMAWCQRVHARGGLLNPPHVVAVSSHKGYLLELAARGVPTAPTALVAAGATLDLTALCAARGWPRIVIKPAVGAGSLGCATFRTDELAAAQAHLAVWAARGDVLVQPYLASVDDYGERSLVWIDGELTHAIRKSPRFAGEDERVTGPHPIADDERAVALAALAPWQDEIMYGRVDTARDAAGQPLVMELELVEPSLFFAKSPAALDRYVAALRRWIG